jgi:hypothetical protein
MAGPGRRECNPKLVSTEGFTPFSVKHSFPNAIEIKPDPDAYHFLLPAHHMNGATREVQEESMMIATLPGAFLLLKEAVSEPCRGRYEPFRSHFFAPVNARKTKQDINLGQ